ncbi:multiple epidermal growth factor-like domains protein 8, partial [Neopsephotus bourkii]|uniref:multiple epidermal growth factor-like domains protein 8 n=1 Tax=Neopsephotus bourkii TaxID=309878 RepID=UPI002AA567C8
MAPLAPMGPVGPVGAGRGRGPMCGAAPGAVGPGGGRHRRPRELLREWELPMAAARLSGSRAPPPLRATSGQLLVQLFSDPNYNRGGFAASFRAWPCPGGCWGRGRCDARGRCHCGPHWGGADCSQPRCSASCKAPGGTCNEVSGLCECRPGYVGLSCELELGLPSRGGRWYPVSPAHPSFRPRTAAAGAFLPHTGALYVFGGLDLNSVLGDLVVYNLSTNQWQQLNLSLQPPPRHSHAAARWRQSLVLMGGELAGGALANDVWSLEPEGRGWRELRPLPGGDPAHTPPGLAAHAVAVVDDWLYVFGGRTPHDLFSSLLFRFPLRGGRWERVEPWGGKAPAAAGHSLLFHPPSRALILYGGHRPATA